MAAQALGAGALMAKLDVQSAYRLLPVHPTDRVAWRTLRRRHAVVQTKVGAKNIYGCRRRSGVDRPAAWCAVCRPLDYLNEKMQKIEGEIDGRPVSIIFDGTTHVCEAMVIVLRFVNEKWKIQQRVCA